MVMVRKRRIKKPVELNGGRSVDLFSAGLLPAHAVSLLAVLVEEGYIDAPKIVFQKKTPGRTKAEMCADLKTALGDLSRMIKDVDDQMGELGCKAKPWTAGCTGLQMSKSSLVAARIVVQGVYDKHCTTA